MHTSQDNNASEHRNYQHMESRRLHYSHLWSKVALVDYIPSSLAFPSPGTNQISFQIHIFTGVPLTFDVFGPTCVKATVTFTVLTLSPSSPMVQFPWAIFVDFRPAWKSTRNFDLENSKLNKVSTLIGKIVCTSCRPSCIDVHSAVLINLKKRQDFFSKTRHNECHAKLTECFCLPLNR